MTTDSLKRNLLAKSPDNLSSSIHLHENDDWYMLKDAHEKHLRTVEQLAAFLNIASIVGSDVGIETILKSICDNTTQLMRAERTTIYLVEHHQDKPYLKSFIAEGTGVLEIPFGQGIAGTVAKHREMLNIRDVYQCSLFDPTNDRKTGFVTRSCLTAPIMNIQRDLLGVVQVINKINGDYFSQNDEDMMTSICAQIGVSLTQHQFYTSLANKNAELLEAHRHLQEKNEELLEAHERLKQKNDELDMLYELECEAAVAPDLKSLFERMLAKCMQAFRVEFAAIFVFHGEQNRLFAAQSTENGIVYRQDQPEKCPCFLKNAIHQGECTRFCIRETESLPEQTEHILGYALNSVLLAPLLAEDNPIGALILGTQNPVPGYFQSSDAKLAALFAAHIAPAVSTQMDRVEAEKKQRLFTIGQMMSSLLHDMKTPLANISGYVDIMTDENNPERRTQYAKVVERQIRTLTNMSAEILQFARGESAIILRPNDLHTLLNQAIDLLRTEAENRHIEIKRDEKFQGKISCDDDKLQRVIVNLVKNAMEAIDHHGQITISTYTDNQYAYLSIADNGPGIPAQIANSVFDAFVTSGKKGGTGLGLSIVKKIIDEHKATITVHPVEPHGTQFVMAFKLM